MRRVNLFLMILIVSLASLIALTVIGVAVFTYAPASGSQYPSSWMGDMWGMMGGATPTSVQNPVLPYFGVMFVVLIGVTVTGIGGVAFFVIFFLLMESFVAENA